MKTSLVAAILAALRDGLETTPLIAARVGVSCDIASSRLNSLVKQGQARRLGVIAQPGRKPLTRWTAIARPPPLSALPPLPDVSGMSLTAVLLGDPPPGRSAADKRLR